MAYDKRQFEAAFQLITAISNQIIKVDFDEMENWIEKILGPRSLKDDEVKGNLENLKTVMQSYVVMSTILRTHGIPVRDIQHYKDSVPQTPEIDPTALPTLPVSDP